MLFSFRPYSEQETLPLNEAEVLTILDLFCEAPESGPNSQVTSLHLAEMHRHHLLPN